MLRRSCSVCAWQGLPGKVFHSSVQIQWWIECCYGDYSDNEES